MCCCSFRLVLFHAFRARADNAKSQLLAARIRRTNIKNVPPPPPVSDYYWRECSPSPLCTVARPGDVSERSVSTLDTPPEPTHVRGRVERIRSSAVSHTPSVAVCLRCRVHGTQFRARPFSPGGNILPTAIGFRLHHLPTYLLNPKQPGGGGVCIPTSTTPIRLSLRVVG